MPQQPADAIVVLSGTVNAPLPGCLTRTQVPTRIAVCNTPSIFSGPGNIADSRDWRRRGETAPTPKRCGVPSNRKGSRPRNAIATETRSDDTSTTMRCILCNSSSPWDLRIVLVLEANGMPRAIRSHSAYGITVVPAATRFTQLSDGYADYVPSWQGLKTNGETIHEVGGLIYYKLRGWI